MTNKNTKQQNQMVTQVINNKSNPIANHLHHNYLVKLKNFIFGALQLECITHHHTHTQVTHTHILSIVAFMQSPVSKRK